MSRQKLKHQKKSDSPFPIPFLSQFCYTTDLGLLYRFVSSWRAIEKWSCLSEIERVSGKYNDAIGVYLTFSKI